MLVGGSVLGAAAANYYTRSPVLKHPYLLAHAQDFVKAKETLVQDPKANSYYEDLQRQAEDVFDAEPSFYRVPDPIRQKPHILWISRQVLERVYTLAMLYRLDGTRRYAERAWEELRAAANFPDWYPKQFLGTAEMSHAFAIGYDWLYDALDAEQLKILRTAMVEKGLKPALKRYRDQKPGGWVNAVNNWNLVCNSGIGLGALAIKDEAPYFSEEIEEILKHALRSLEGAMAQFAPDGGWAEGLTYWSYGTYYVTLFLAALETVQGETAKLLQAPGFSETGFFPLYLTGPSFRTFNFADSDSSLPESPHLFWLSRKFNRPVYDWYQERVELPRRPPHALDLLWYNSPTVTPRGDNLPLDKHFRGTDVVVLRSAWEDPDAVFVGFKAGDNKVGHSHLDRGSFVLDALGARWALDLGASNYDVPGYGDNGPAGKRWTYYRTRAEGHNTLVIDSGSEPDQNPESASNIIRFRSEPQQAFAVADLTSVHTQNIRKAWRGVSLLDRRQVLVQDEVEAIDPAEAWWFMHTDSDGILLGRDGATATLSREGVQLWARILSPAWATFTVMDAKPLPTSPNPVEQGENNGVRKLGIYVGGVTNLQLAVLLVPLREGESSPYDLPGVRLLSEW